MSFNQIQNQTSEKIFTKSEKESAEWLMLAAELKLKELMNNPDSDKLRLATIQSDVKSIFMKILNN
jgi:hypothetical protein